MRLIFLTVFIIYLRKYNCNRQIAQSYASIYRQNVYLRKYKRDDTINKTGGLERNMEEKKNTTTNNGAQTTATKAKNKFNTKNYDRLYPFVKAGEKAKIEQAAKAAGQSLNDYIVTAIYQRMERERV